MRMELTLLMPCLNEAETIEGCVAEARRFLDEHGVCGEVLVADNGSTDGSQDLARGAGARVVQVPVRGYGSALRHGIQAASGRYVIMGDADGSYDFGGCGPILDELRRGAQLVMGNRFAGGIQPGAMPPLHRYLGNPVLSALGRLFFPSPVRDFHCGLRGFQREAIQALALRSDGMEFASEMVVKATLAELRIREVPVILRPDGRSRPPHLRSWRDGWRHLRFLLLMSPRWLLLYPGLTLLLAGAALQIALWRQPIVIGGVGLDIHTMLYGAGATIMGLQMVIFSLLARAAGASKGLLPPRGAFQSVMRAFTLERGLILGGAMVVAGLGLSVYSVHLWVSGGLSTLRPETMMRLAIPALTLLLSGMEVFFASFVLSIVMLSGRDAANADPST